MPKIPEDGKFAVSPAEISNQEKPSTKARAGNQLEKPTKEEWEAYKIEIKKLNVEVRQKADEVLGEDGCIWMQQQAVDFTDQLKKNGIDYKHCIAWHIIIGSGMDYENAPRLDFPNSYNVKNFLSQLRDELNNKEKCQRYIDKVD